MTSFWRNIWDQKGSGESTDLLYLDGYEHLDIPFKSDAIAKHLSLLLEIHEGSRVLEVGCGCGFLSREFQGCNYVGVDYSEAIINKHLSLFPSHNVLVSEASSLNFPDSSFDKVFCFGVFQYLPSLSYADKVIEEMERVSSDMILLGDLKNIATREEHLVYPQDRLLEKGFIFSECVYDPSDNQRYNALLKIQR